VESINKAYMEQPQAIATVHPVYVLLTLISSV